jgi:hypothetical protein
MTLLAAALLTACTRSPSEDSLESLERDPGRLRLVLEQCKQASEATGERKCRMAAEAWRQRFFGDSHAKRSGDGRAYEGSRP